MKGKIALVTGASRGIGKAVLQRLSGEGALVIGTYVKSRTQAESLCMDHACEMHQVDMSKLDQVRDLFEHIKQVHGRLDVIVNNAGIHQEIDLAKMRKGDMTKMFDVNFFGPAWVTRYALTLLAPNSSIVNMASNGGLRGGVKAPHYAASKAALISWTKSMSRLLAPKTRVNALAPGMIQTDIFPTAEGIDLSSVPMGRLGTPEEVATAVWFLSDPNLSGYVTGQTLVIDGGQYV